jgi:hypothetical protein
MSKSDHRWPGSSEKCLPILIDRDAFGAGLPARDLIVSPQHKILLPASDTRADRASHVLALVKGLMCLAGIREMKVKRSITYYHILMKHHEILFSEPSTLDSACCQQEHPRDRRANVLSEAVPIRPGSGSIPRPRREIPLGLHVRRSNCRTERSRSLIGAA